MSTTRCPFVLYFGFHTGSSWSGDLVFYPMGVQINLAVIKSNLLGKRPINDFYVPLLRGLLVFASEKRPQGATRVLKKAILTEKGSSGAGVMARLRVGSAIKWGMQGPSSLNQEKKSPCESGGCLAFLCPLPAKKLLGQKF